MCFVLLVSNVFAILIELSSYIFIGKVFIFKITFINLAIKINSVEQLAREVNSASELANETVI